jgi:hypothetical protein
MGIAEDASEALNRVSKWRSVLAGRIWGTEAKSPKTRGQVDIFEKLIILRCEASALVALLVAKGVFTIDEMNAQVIEEADALDLAYSLQFPGIRAVDDGIEIYDVLKAVQTMKGWPR